MPTRQAPRVSPGCCRHQVTSRPQPTHLPPPPPRGRPTPYALASFRRDWRQCPQTDPIARAVCQEAGRASTNFPLLMCTLQLGRGGGCPRSGVSHLLCCPAKKITHKNPGSFLNQPSGVPQREEEIEKLRDTERQKRERDEIEEGQKEAGKGRDRQRQSGWKEEEEKWADKERKGTVGQTGDAVHSLCP